MERPKAPKDDGAKLAFLSNSCDRYRLVQRPSHESVETVGSSSTLLCESPIPTEYRIPAISSLDLPGQSGQELIGLQIPEMKSFFESLRKHKDVTSFDLIMCKDKIILEYDDTSVVLVQEKVIHKQSLYRYFDENSKLMKSPCFVQISTVAKLVPQPDSKSPENSHHNRQRSPVPVQNAPASSSTTSKSIADENLTSVADILANVKLETALIHIMPLSKRNGRDLRALITQNTDAPDFFTVLAKLADDPKVPVLRRAFISQIDPNWPYYTQKGRDAIANYLAEHKIDKEDYQPMAVHHNTTQNPAKSISPPPNSDYKRTSSHTHTEVAPSSLRDHRKAPRIELPPKPSENSEVDSEGRPATQPTPSPKKSPTPKKVIARKPTKPLSKAENGAPDTERLRQEFREDYKQYCELYEKIADVKRRFETLKRALDSTTNQAERSRLTQDVRSSYDLHSEVFKKDVAEYKQLHDKLQDKKRRIELSETIHPNNR